jgi:hypothetical protein
MKDLTPRVFPDRRELDESVKKAEKWKKPTREEYRAPLPYKIRRTLAVSAP